MITELNSANIQTHIATWRKYLFSYATDKNRPVFRQGVFRYIDIFKAVCYNRQEQQMKRVVLVEIQILAHNFTVCKVENAEDIDMHRDFCFVGKTDEEISLVCPTEIVPQTTTAREDGWKGFRIQGVLDFSLVGILSEISALLAKNHISIFAISTYNTDYIFVKEKNLEKACTVLASAGYSVH